jgi:TonB-dependent starch-binding outer membrane protein SusC
MIFKRLLAKFALPLLCVLFTQAAVSQTKVITGKVSDDKGNAVQGATVTVKGSKSGTSTDATGSFSLTVPQGAKTLVITSVGFGQQEVGITGQTSVTVSLVASSQSLSDVVVIGYGTAQRKDVTGSVASVKSKDFDKGVTSPEELLIGKVAGLQIANNNGQP